MLRRSFFKAMAVAMAAPAAFVQTARRVCMPTVVVQPYLTDDTAWFLNRDYAWKLGRAARENQERRAASILSSAFTDERSRRL